MGSGTLRSLRTRCVPLALRVFLTALALIIPVHSNADAYAPASTLTGLHDFDFQVGNWRVHHRLKRAGAGDWVEFDGTCSNRRLMEGWSNVEDHIFSQPSGVTHGVGLRAYDPKTGQWAIWWLDGRDPFGALDPPVKGRFENGVGTFYSDYVDHGKPMRVRFTWSHITPASAHWEQAYSADAGKTWETNWIMEFRRVT
jgi:hypothetical protein